MRIISLAPFESPQESHRWHAQKLTQLQIDSLDQGLCITIYGDDKSNIDDGTGPLFHIPLLGGWRNYVVLEVELTSPTWYVGWVVREKETQNILRSDLHKLPIIDRRVRLLKGTPKRSVTFFAVDATGVQLPVQFVGEGKMGDGSEYRKIRLL